MVPRRQHRGFTLLEIAVALSIVAVLAGITLLALSGLKSRGNFASATGDVIVALKQARSEAYGRGSTTVMVVDTAGARWWLLEDVGSDFDLNAFDPNNPTALGDRFIRSGTFPTGITFGPTNGYGQALPAPFQGVPSYPGASPAPAYGYCSFCLTAGAKAGYGFARFSPGRPVTFSAGPSGVSGQQLTIVSGPTPGAQVSTLAILARTGATMTFTSFQ